MPVDVVRPGEEFLESLRTDRAHRREAHGGPHREASADPVPHRQHLIGAEVLRERHIGGHGDEMFRAPALGRFGVGHGLLRGEGLRDDDEQRAVRIGALQRAREILRIDVGCEAHVEPAVLQRIGHQARTQVGAAGAEVHDALESSFASYPGRDRLYALQGGANFVARIGGAQFGMPGGPILGVVDMLAGQQRRAPVGKAAVFGKARQEPQRHHPQALARIVVAQAGGIGHELDAARGVVGEELAQVHAAPAFRMVQQLRPGAARGRRGGVHFCSR
jgi:hypothetical protein